MQSRRSVIRPTLIVIALATAPLAHAAPTDDFFTPGAGAEASLVPVNTLFETIDAAAAGTPEGHAQAITEAVNEQVAAMQLFEGTWFSLDRELRERFIAAFPEAMRAHLETLGISALHVDAIEPTDSANEFAVGGRLATRDDEAIAVTWTVRVRGSDANIIRAESAAGTILLPPAARDLAAEDELDLDAIMQTLN